MNQFFPTLPPTKLQIALFTYSTQPRGSVVHTLELAEALYALGHQVCVYALDKDGKGFDYPLSCECKLIPAQPASTEIDVTIKQRIQEFVQYLEQVSLSYDYYHAQDCISANALCKLRELGKIPHFVRTVHHIEDYSSPYLEQCQERSIREADLCFCVSETWQNSLRQHYQIQAPRVINGVNLNRFSTTFNGSESRLKEQWKLSGSPIYLTVGGIEPRKNSIRLIQAFREVLNESPNAQLVIAGGSTLFDYPDYRDKLFAVANDLQIEINRSLIILGAIADAELTALYRIADAFVFPSVKEGWGLVVMEAIASGLPVITSNQPPFTEFLSETQALLVDPNSVNAIAQAMNSILHPDFDFLTQQSQSILSRYTWEASAKMHLEYYQQLSNSY